MALLNGVENETILQTIKTINFSSSEVNVDLRLDITGVGDEGPDHLLLVGLDAAIHVGNLEGSMFFNFLSC